MGTARHNYTDHVIDYHVISHLAARHTLFFRQVTNNYKEPNTEWLQTDGALNCMGWGWEWIEWNLYELSVCEWSAKLYELEGEWSSKLYELEGEGSAKLYELEGEWSAKLYELEGEWSAKL